ncbi:MULTISPECIES: hypothetical protein [unclassified Novosphingobium]|uniref:hypothetical protein n=1 Tax=unclassified Novosphingobium TaxID=2644732 RepID=UPI0025D497CF|nr:MULTISPECIES: hypothetical protein [unclassified Novosphingobium]HQV03036.1 hypothetical protein [Novosphingobium sp.]
MSPRTRRLYDLFEQAKDIDRQRRARHQLLRLPKDWTGSLWAEGESHPLGGVADENYRAETLGTVAEEQTEHAHHAAKLARRGKRKGKDGGSEEVREG